MRKAYILFVSVLFFIFLTGCQSEEIIKKKEKEPLPNHSVFNLDEESIKELENGSLKGTPLKVAKDVVMSDIEEAWGTPHEHHDYEDIQTYSYIIDNQRFVINEDEMKDIYSVHVELDYTKKQILELMGEPTQAGNILLYEKEHHVIQFEKFGEKWRLIIRSK